MKIFFYGALTIALIALVLFVIDFLSRRQAARKKADADKEADTEKKILAFLQDEKGDYSLVRMRKVFRPDELESMLSRKDILSFFLQYGKLEDVVELMESTQIRKHSPLTRKMLLNSLVRDPRAFKALVKAYGEKEAEKILAESIHYQSYRGREEALFRSVDRAMSGHDSGQDERYAASLLWFSIHSGNAKIVEEVLRLGRSAIEYHSDFSGESEIDLVCETGDERMIDLVFKSGVSRKKNNTHGSYLAKLLKRDFSGDYLLKYARMFAADGRGFDASEFEPVLRQKNIYPQILELFPLRPEDPMISGLAHQIAKTSGKTDTAPFVLLSQYFQDLIGYDQFREKFEFEISDWSTKPARTRMKLFWGPPSIGKTELCLRLSGLKQGFRQPKEFAEVIYITPANLGALGSVFNAPERNLILVDDFHTIADRELSVNYHQQLHKEFLVQLKTAVSVTNHYWVFMVSRKQSQGLSESEILKMFGEDLGGYVDYEDWGLPKWGIWELAKFVDAHKEMGKLFDEEGMANVVSRIHAKGMGPKEINRIVNFAHALGSRDKLNQKQISMLLEKIGA